MSKYLEVWEPVLRKCEEYYPHVLLNMRDWYPSGRNEITILTQSGESMIYNFVSNRVRRIPTITDPDSDISEIEWRNKFAERLRNKIRVSGINQWQIAELTGISEISISKYMNAKATPSTHNLMKIARVLKCSYSELIDDI